MTHVVESEAWVQSTIRPGVVVGFILFCIKGLRQSWRSPHPFYQEVHINDRTR